MQLNSDTLPANSRQDFCLALKAARERKAISLDEIAEKTKIPASLFAELERNDLHRWPNGLFRRSFFRDYVRMIGVPVTEACAEFSRLFLDEEATPLAPPVHDITEKRRPVLETLTHAGSVITTAWRRGADAVSQALAWANAGASEHQDEAEIRPWITDARRVRSAPPPRIRVRIKRPR